LPTPRALSGADPAPGSASGTSSTRPTLLPGPTDHSSTNAPTCNVKTGGGLVPLRLPTLEGSLGIAAGGRRKLNTQQGREDAASVYKTKKDMTHRPASHEARGPEIAHTGPCGPRWVAQAKRPPCAAGCPGGRTTQRSRTAFADSACAATPHTIISRGAGRDGDRAEARQRFVSRLSVPDPLLTRADGLHPRARATAAASPPQPLTPPRRARLTALPPARVAARACAGCARSQGLRACPSRAPRAASS